jgi:hypothetical protein
MDWKLVVSFFNSIFKFTFIRHLFRLFNFLVCLNVSSLKWFNKLLLLLSLELLKDWVWSVNVDSKSFNLVVGAQTHQKMSLLVVEDLNDSMVWLLSYTRVHLQNHATFFLKNIN